MKHEARRFTIIAVAAILFSLAAHGYVTVRPSTSLESVAQVGSTLFFSSWYQVYATDGTEAGTSTVWFDDLRLTIR